jgi:hypothetical protein
MGVDWITSTSTTPPLYDRPSVYDMPPVYDHSKKQTDKVSILKRFLRIFLDLMQYESVLSSLCRMIDHCSPKKQKHVTQRAINQVRSKKKRNREF